MKASSSEALADVDALLRNLGHPQAPELVKRVEPPAERAGRRQRQPVLTWNGSK